jgi:PAS domain S-box-containing protein
LEPTMPDRRHDADIMYRLLVQGVTDYAIYMLCPDGTVANWNVGAQRATGYAADEIVGHNFACFYTPDDRAAGLPERGLRTARQDGRFEAEGWRLRKDGSRFWAHVVIDAIHDDDGRFIGFAKVTRDRTEGRANTLKLDSALDNLDLAMSNMAQGLCLIDGDERIVLANQRMHEMLALPGGEPLSGGWDTGCAVRGARRDGRSSLPARPPATRPRPSGARDVRDRASGAGPVRHDPAPRRRGMGLDLRRRHGATPVREPDPAPRPARSSDGSRQPRDAASRPDGDARIRGMGELRRLPH